MHHDKPTGKFCFCHSAFFFFCHWGKKGFLMITLGNQTIYLLALKVFSSCRWCLFAGRKLKMLYKNFFWYLHKWMCLI